MGLPGPVRDGRNPDQSNSSCVMRGNVDAWDGPHFGGKLAPTPRRGGRASELVELCPLWRKDAHPGFTVRVAGVCVGRLCGRCVRLLESETAVPVGVHVVRAGNSSGSSKSGAS